MLYHHHQLPHMIFISDKSDASTGIIVPVIVGGTGFIAIVAIIVCVVCLKKKHKRKYGHTYTHIRMYMLRM